MNFFKSEKCSIPTSRPTKINECLHNPLGQKFDD